MIKCIKKTIRNIVAFFIKYLGISFLIREIICRNKATIILYHDPFQKKLKKHIQFLSKRYNFISLHQLIDAIEKKNWNEIPPKALVITLDDGIKENYELTEIFKKNKICPTIYLCSNIINTNNKYWFRNGDIELRRKKTFKKKIRLTHIQNEQVKTDYDENHNRHSLNEKEIQKMKPYIDFQSHSKYHSILINCTNEECIEEIKGSKIQLEDLLKKEIKHFSYPNGDYSNREIEYLIKYGYMSSRTIDLGWNDINTNKYKLKCMSIEDDASLNILNAQIIGFFGYLRYLRHGSFTGKHPKYV